MQVADGTALCVRRRDARRRQRGRCGPRRGRHEWRWRLARRPARTSPTRWTSQPNDYLASFYVDLAGLAEASGATADLGERHDRQRRPRRRARWPAAERQRAALDGLGRRSSAAPRRRSRAPSSTGCRSGHARRGRRLRPARRARGRPSRSPATCRRARRSRARSTRFGRWPPSASASTSTPTCCRSSTARRRSPSAASVRTACRRASSCSARPIRTPPPASLGRIADRIGASGGSSSTETLDGIDITTIAIPDIGEVGVRRRRRRRRHRPERRGRRRSCRGAQQPDSPSTGRARYEQAFDVAGVRAGTEVFVDVGTRRRAR